MAPGLNGRQTGTVPKNKVKSNGSQSQKSSKEHYNQSVSFYFMSLHICKP